MANKPTELLEKFSEKVKKAKELHEFEWNWLKRSCPHRKKGKNNDVCEHMTLSKNNTRKYVYYCHFANCRYT
jgi:hypothetical protein